MDTAELLAANRVTADDQYTVSARESQAHADEFCTRAEEFMESARTFDTTILDKTHCK
jgi:hypothetical protein